jgi:hypothetical protein
MIRLEFADLCHDYYTELDGIGISGYINRPKYEEEEIVAALVYRTISTDEKEKGLFDLPVFEI